MRRLIPLVLAATAVLVLAGCRGAEVMTVKELLDDPSRFDGKQVRVVGEVRESIGALGYGAYRLDDGTGTIPVVSKEGGAPRTGARVGVEGAFRAVFTLGTESHAAIVESRRTTP
jgi:hypothetical protein